MSDDVIMFSVLMKATFLLSQKQRPTVGYGHLQDISARVILQTHDIHINWLQIFKLKESNWQWFSPVVGVSPLNVYIYYLL